MSKPKLFANVFMKSPLVAHAVTSSKFDGAVLDFQHGELTLESCWAQIEHFKQKHMEVWARVPDFDRGMVGRLLDFGVDKIIQPMVNSPAAAEELVDSCAYAPVGSRSFGPLRVDGTPSVHLENSAGKKAIVQIETRASVENLSAIASVDSLSGLYVGPADLALSLGASFPPVFSEPPLSNAIQSIRETAHAQGIDFIIHLPDLKQADVLAGLDPDVLIVQSDLDCMRSGMAHSIRILKGEG